MITGVLPAPFVLYTRNGHSISLIVVGKGDGMDLPWVCRAKLVDNLVNIFCSYLSYKANVSIDTTLCQVLADNWYQDWEANDRD